MKKKGDIWISAVIYIALGVVVLTVVLAAGLPVIQKMKDQYTISQTKEIMFRIDESIRSVYSQGPGAQIPLKTKISRGELKVFEDEKMIIWTFPSKVMKSELNTEIQEGNLQTITTENPILKGKYVVNLSLNYSAQSIDLSMPQQIDFLGVNQILIRNEGASETIPANINISITSI